MRDEVRTRSTSAALGLRNPRARPWGAARPPAALTVACQGNATPRGGWNCAWREYLPMLFDRGFTRTGPENWPLGYWSEIIAIA
jgi:hypothetical protein